MRIQNSKGIGAKLEAKYRSLKKELNELKNKNEQEPRVPKKMNLIRMRVG